MDRDLRVILQIAESEAALWETAQASAQSGNQSSGVTQSPIIESHGPRCFIDGSWKVSHIFSGFGWIYVQKADEEVEMGARNTRRSLSPLHSELEALVWTMHCMISHEQNKVVFITWQWWLNLWSGQHSQST